MNWQDSVMSDKQIAELQAKYSEPSDESVGYERNIAQAQAEISFKAGARKVVESTQLLLKEIDKLVGDIEGDWTDPRSECHKISSLIGDWQREWQAFVKGLEGK
jgi:hypothetical protein